MPTLGAPELILILAVVLILFGVGRLPEVGGALGKGIREFRRSQTESDDRPKQSQQPPEAQPLEKQ